MFWRSVQVTIIVIAACASAAIANAQVLQQGTMEVKAEDLEMAIKSGATKISVRAGISALVDLSELKPASRVSIVAADPASPPIIRRLRVRHSANLSFDNFIFQHGDTPHNAALVEITSSSNIVISRARITAEERGDNRQRGILVEDTQGFALQDSRVESVERGLVLLRSSEIEIAHNLFKRLSISALSIVESQNVTISSNKMEGFWPEQGVAATFIHAWTRGTTKPTRSVSILDNVMLQNTSTLARGILFSNEDRVNYDQIRISGNLILISGGLGISIERATNAVAERNIVLDTIESTLNSSIRFIRVLEGRITENIAVAYGLVENRNITFRKNGNAPRNMIRVRKVLIERIEAGLAGRGDGRVQGGMQISTEQRLAGPRI